MKILSLVRKPRLLPVSSSLTSCMYKNGFFTRCLDNMAVQWSSSQEVAQTFSLAAGCPYDDGVGLVGHISTKTIWSYKGVGRKLEEANIQIGLMPDGRVLYMENQFKPN